MYVMPVPIVSSVRLEVWWKLEQSSMVVTLSGMERLVTAIAPLNAPSLIFFRPSGNVNEVRFTQPVNSFGLSTVVPLGTVRLVMLRSMMDLNSSSLSPAVVVIWLILVGYVENRSEGCTTTPFSIMARAKSSFVFSSSSISCCIVGVIFVKVLVVSYLNS